MRKGRVGLGLGLALLAAAGLLAGSAVGQGASANGFGAAAVDAARQLSADKEPGAWMSAGRTYDEQRYSPLTSINKANVKGLGLTWYGDIDTERGQESTPVVVDGVLYITTAWSMVYAYNAKTGEQLWRYDPKVDRGNIGGIACCDVVNRGIAAWKGKIYLGALDGRLIALDAKTGKEVWTTQTSDLKLPYTITQVPRIVRGMVVVGNGGAEYSVRGYVSAYDSETGKLKWRFYTVPRNPATDEYERPARTEEGGQDLVGATRQQVRRRSHGLGHHRLRPEDQPDLFRHRQRPVLVAVDP